jgi:hypothetical protein
MLESTAQLMLAMDYIAKFVKPAFLAGRKKFSPNVLNPS